MSKYLPQEKTLEKALGLLHPNDPIKVRRGGTDKESRRRERTPRPSFSRTHLKSVLRNNRADERIAEFRLCTHTPAQISTALIHFLPAQENLSKLGIRAIDEAFSHIKRYEELRSRPNQIPEDANLLTEYLHLFDRLYFCGALGPHVYVEVATRGTGGLEMNDYGDFCSHRDGSRWRPRAGALGRIRIADMAHRTRFADPEVRLHHYLGTLLHEAIHAVFELYVCFRHRGCEARERRYMGDDGHGWIFAEVAIALEGVSGELPRGGFSIL